MKNWFKENRNEVVYWLGLGLLFVGLEWGVSAATVVGGIMVLESMVTSYLVTWINARN